MRRRLPFVLSPILFLWFAVTAISDGAYFTGGAALTGAIVLAAVARWAW
jgi:hypothetical protein